MANVDHSMYLMEHCSMGNHITTYGVQGTLFHGTHGTLFHGKSCNGIFYDNPRPVPGSQGWVLRM